MSDDLKILDSFINFAVKTYNRSGQGEGDDIDYTLKSIIFKL